jgi:hydroxymethylbilane synthase
VIAVQGRTGIPAADVASAASHASTMACLAAERAAVQELSASCNAPVGIHAEVVTNGLLMRGFAGLPDGSAWVAVEVTWEPGGAEAGAELARRMLVAGAGDLLREAEAMAT